MLARKWDVCLRRATFSRERNSAIMNKISTGRVDSMEGLGVPHRALVIVRSCSITMIVGSCSLAGLIDGSGVTVLVSPSSNNSNIKPA